jgi:hypothetical protein
VEHLSDYQLFLTERDQIDVLLQKGYFLKNITENLSGDFIEFEHINNKEVSGVTLHILTAEGRKYYTSLLWKDKQLD